MNHHTDLFPTPAAEPETLAPLVIATCNGSPSQQWELH